MRINISTNGTFDTKTKEFETAFNELYFEGVEDLKLRTTVGFDSPDFQKVIVDWLTGLLQSPNPDIQRKAKGLIGSIFLEMSQEQ